MLKEALQFITGQAIEASKVQEFLVEDRRYTDRPLVGQQAPMPEAIQVDTLTGLCDLLHGKVNDLDYGQVLVHVRSPKLVTVESRLPDVWGRRQVHVRAQLPTYGAFNFGQYQEQAAFLIQLQTFFVHGVGDHAALLQVVGKLVADTVDTSEDDGITQTVTAKKGVALTERKALKPIVELAPWRTFREIEQPLGRFLLRVQREDGEAPELALFVADGELWQIEALGRISAYLEFELNATGISVVA